MVEKREPRSYKAKSKIYYKAVRRAWSNQTTLAKLIETWVEVYGNGDNITYQVVEKKKK